MKRYFSTISLLFIAALFFGACKKTETRNLWKAEVAPSSPVSDAAPLCGSIKGTMLSGKTYTIGCDVFVNAGDTLILQEGVTVKFTGPYGLGVKGALISLGSQAHPNYFTYDGATKTDVYGNDPSKDIAYKGKWIGIIGATTCPMMIFKWTHIEFGGAAIPSSSAISQIYASPYPMFFQNPAGILVFEDSWLYGSTDDPFRILGGKIEIMRSTFEKCGYTGGEAMNAKAGTIGDFAYNLCIGMATNGPKLSNISAPVGFPGSNMRIYNNTIVNCGYRRAATGRGGSINFEQGAGGMAYNNLIVNCKFGLRVVQNPIADTANLFYGYNYTYVDSSISANNIYPSLPISTSITKAMSTDLPSPSTFLPAGWQPGDAYTAPASILGANDPQFINGPVPMPAGLLLRDIAFVGNYNFALKPGSPCIGKGYTGFAPRADVPVDLTYGVTEITAPGKDIGAFQANGTGNHH
ncbi:MAG TPA: hypothetical protein VL832_26860 [Puia sp.]|jgi:hypothetical protein|nr:hypothetical protein [Puia sp.]